MKKITLTPKQKETLDFIKEFLVENGESPRVRDIQAKFNLKSLRSVTQRLESLESKGFIKRDKFKHNSITVIDQDHPFGNVLSRIPVIASAGCDAMQIYAQENFDEYISVDKKLLASRKDIVAIKAIGNSMLDAGIKNGDYVLVEVSEEIQSGDRVVAIVGDMAVIKKLKQAPGVTILESESKQYGYPPIILSEDSKIFGKVLSVIPFSQDIESNEEEIIYDPGFEPKDR